MKKLTEVILANVILLVSAQAHGEVVYATAGGFSLEVSRDVSVEPGDAYARFLRVGEWWNGAHTWFGDARNMSIDPQAGGCFCEREGDKSAFHMLVTYVDPGKAMHMVGGLGPLQGLGLHGAMQWQFEANDAGGTTIIHRYRVTGYYPDGLEALATVVDQVQTDQVNRLQARIMDKAP